MAFIQNDLGDTRTWEVWNILAVILLLVTVMACLALTLRPLDPPTGPSYYMYSPLLDNVAP